MREWRPERGWMVELYDRRGRYVVLQRQGGALTLRPMGRPASRPLFLAAMPAPAGPAELVALLRVFAWWLTRLPFPASMGNVCAVFGPDGIRVSTGFEGLGIYTVQAR